MVLHSCGVVVIIVMQGSSCSKGRWHDSLKLSVLRNEHVFESEVQGKRQVSASFPVVLGDFGCDVTCQACRENSPRMPGK